MIVSCGDVSQTITLTDTRQDYTVELNRCSADNIKLSMTASKKRFYVYHVDIYNGNLNLNPPTLRAVSEQGDSTWRDISGITDTCYTVNALAKGTFEYLVKAIYLDGTESNWSNIMYVTLAGDGNQPLIGDINNDSEVTVADVTALISIILGGPIDDETRDRADLNRDREVNVADVTTLISILLRGH